MADQADVETALVELASAALYPNGTGSSSAVTATVRLYRGWPNAAALDGDLASGHVTVTVFPMTGSTRVTTRYAQDWEPGPTPPSLTVQSSGIAVTFSGSADPGQLAGVLADGQAFVHRTNPGDTPGLVASSLAVAIGRQRPVLASGASVIVPTANLLVGRTAADATALLELRSQRQRFRLTAWCPSPMLRDATCGILDSVLAGTPFLALPDGVFCRLRYVSTTSLDQREDATLYRRDLLYDVEYPTTQTAVQPSMLFGVIGLGANTIIA